jgi:metal-dependent amidase/aminoacylase/carboxypeptidase family protein
MNHELKEVITTKVSAIYEKIKGYREHLHQNPELSYQEFNTMEYVAAKLKEIGIPYEKGVAGTGIVGIISSSKHRFACRFRCLANSGAKHSVL